MLKRIRRAATRRTRCITNHFTASELRANRNHLPAALESSDACARYATFALRR